MSSFTKPLHVCVEQRERRGRGLATILTAFEYHVGELGSGDVITVPEGYETDFVSVPWWARGFIPVLGLAAKAAVIHDFLLDEGKRSVWEIDHIFNEAMGVLLVPRFQRWLMYKAVRLYHRFQ